MGFVPTRWGSVCDCLDSFCQMRECVTEYQENKKCAIFSKRDFELVDMVGSLFAQFRDVSQMLMDADRMEGMATIFEAVNAIYMLLFADAEIEGPFHSFNPER